MKVKLKNVSILAGSVVVFCFALFLVRSQATIEDRAWMKAMIPHHSIAILTSVSAQEREIKEMKWLIADIKENGIASSESEASRRPVPDFSGE